MQCLPPFVLFSSLECFPRWLNNHFSNLLTNSEVDWLLKTRLQHKKRSIDCMYGLTLTNLSTPPEASLLICLHPGCTSTLYIGSLSCHDISGVVTFITKLHGRGNELSQDFILTLWSVIHVNKLHINIHTLHWQLTNTAQPQPFFNFFRTSSSATL